MTSKFKNKVMLRCLYIVAFIILVACEKLERSEEVPFEGDAFGFEMRAKTTLETTLHYRKIYFKPAGSNDMKVLIGSGSIEMDVFPIDSTLLAHIDYTIIDTVARTMDKLPPTQESHTLYVNPDLFSKEDYNKIVKFVKSCYLQPIEKNKIIQWLDSDVIALEDGHIYYTVYAIVYKNLAELEPEYHAVEGEDYVRVKVNNKVWASYKADDGLETGGFYYELRHDTLFYPDYEEKAMLDRILAFKNQNGESFAAKAKVLISVAPK